REVCDLLFSELSRARAHTDDDASKAEREMLERAVADLVTLCRQHRRRQGDPDAKKPLKLPNFDGAFLVRQLAAEGLWDAHVCLLGKPVAREKPDDPPFSQIVRLAPTTSEQRLLCDLTSRDGKSADLPRGMGDTEGYKELAGSWLDRAAMGKVLAGEGPDPKS